MEGAFQHNLIDAYASAGTALAAIVILVTGYERADPIASLLIAVPMLRSGYKLLIASGRIFLEAAPEGLDPEQIGRSMAAHPGISEVHDLHVWEVTSGFPALSAHVLVGPGADCSANAKSSSSCCTTSSRLNTPHFRLNTRGHCCGSTPLALRLAARSPDVGPGFRRTPRTRGRRCRPALTNRLLLRSLHGHPAVAAFRT